MLYPPTRILVALLGLVFLISLPLAAQEEVKVLKGKQKVLPKEDYSLVVVNHVFPGETLDPVPSPKDPLEYIHQASLFMGGMDNFEALEDLSYSLTHKTYTDKGLLYVEEAIGYAQFGKHLWARLDFDYQNHKDIEFKIDYREVSGEDGSFKFLDGKILRDRDAVNESAERLLHMNLLLYAPLHLPLEKADPQYMGVSSWTQDLSGKQVTEKCHKIQIVFPRKLAYIRKNLVSLLIDVETHELRRIVYQSRRNTSSRDQQVLIDFVQRKEQAGLKFPTYVEETLTAQVDDWEEILIRKIWFDQFKVNEGLKGIAFDMVNQ